MIIEPKGTKQTTEPSEGRHRFEFKTAEKLSRVPLYVSVLVLGVAAYLKSALPALSHVLDGHAHPLHGTAPDHSSRAASLVRFMQSDIIDQNHSRSAPDLDHLPVRDQWDLIAQNLPLNIDFLPPFTPPLLFNQNDDVAGLQHLFPMAFGVSPSNDNQAHRQTSTAVSEPVTSASLTLPKVAKAEVLPATVAVPPAIHPSEPPKEPDPVPPPPGGRTNRSPVVTGPVRLNDVFAGQAVLIGLSQLLLGADDPDGNPLSIVNLEVAGATVSHVQNGWILAAASGTLGPVLISYQISDGQAHVDQTASLKIVRHVTSLTAGSDIAVGTPYDDDIDALAGNDMIDALAGNDFVSGGEGNDHIIGGSGGDHLFGNDGNDIIFGGAGNDIIFGGGGDDVLSGDEGDDIVSGGTGDDLLLGGDGNDIVNGGDGNDTLDGGAGSDTLMGGIGNDVILADTGDDVIDGGDGHDVLDLSRSHDNLFVDMVHGRAQGGSTGEDIFTSIEETIGGDGDDLFVIGASLAVIVSGGRGHDLFVFENVDRVPTLSQDVVHDILDFVVGDRIRVEDYDISRDADAAEQDFFQQIYGNDQDNWLVSNLSIVVSHERYDDMDHTIIRADMNRDDIYETVIDLHGVTLSIAPQTQIA